MSLNIATVYAQVLCQIGIQHTLLSKIYQDVCNFLSIYNQNDQIDLFLKNPTLTKTYKQQLLHTILKPYLHKKTLTFLLFIIEKGRYTHIKNIFEAFVVQYKKQNNVQIAHVVTAKKITPLLREQLTTLVSKLTDHNHVELIEHNNSALLGGYLLQIGHRQIDTSLATQLKRLKYLIQNQL